MSMIQDVLDSFECYHAAKLEHERATRELGLVGIPPNSDRQVASNKLQQAIANAARQLNSYIDSRIK